MVMETLKINETPVRTSRNFLINNIKLENVELPKTVKEFNNVDIIKTTSIMDKNVSTMSLTYGTGKTLENNIIDNANNKINLRILEEDNIKIIYDFDDNYLELINQIDILAKADCNIIIEYKSETNKKCFHNGIIKVTAEENTNVNIVIVNLLNELSENFESIENKSYNNSNVKYTIIDIGAKDSVSNFYLDIVGDNSNNDLKAIYLGAGNEIKDINYIVDIEGKKSNIDIDVQGALNDNSNKHFKGTINFKKGCKKSKGNENEYCMLLSDKAKSIALPMLLCTEDDVEGNHSTASGKVDNKNLFYIMSRGISYKEAVKLMVKARFNSILERIEDVELKNEIIEKIDRRLD